MPFVTSSRSRARLRQVALATVLLAASTAQAVTFGVLDASGNVVNTYLPALEDWVLAPNVDQSAITAQPGGFSIDLGLGNWGATGDGAQPRQISGAGVLLPAATYGYKVSFSANLRTWDSYNDGAVAPQPGGSLGLWDLFSVNLNTQDFYWNLVDPDSNGNPLPGPEGGGPSLALTSTNAGSAGLLQDALLPRLPAGSVVRLDNSGNQPGLLPGSTWAWGGRDYAAGLFESVRTSSFVHLVANAPVFVSLVLDTRTPYDTDDGYPSWGQFSSPGVFSDVPGGSGGAAPGTSAGNPLMPVDGAGDDGSFEFAPYDVGVDGVGTETFLFVDPEVAVGFQFQVTGGPRVTQVLLPILGDADGFDIEVLSGGQWTVVGHVAEGGTFSFADAVVDFRVTGISAALGLDPNNPVVFVAGLKFDASGSASVSMLALTQAVPEPASYALMLGGLAAVLARRRRRAA
jgi:PEP-CTERM motif